ncbi:hypothetical protein GCM10009596_15220 [Arthrobacter rhombi]|uniref:hypothetical protein n=1 Tax=Arthrobacter rhombi TaxID=71253 RepID=UPI0031E3338E
MLFTIIANVIGLGLVGALVAAVIKKDRANRDDVNPSADGRETQGTMAGHGA